MLITELCCNFSLALSRDEIIVPFLISMYFSLGSISHFCAICSIVVCWDKVNYRLNLETIYFWKYNTYTFAHVKVLLGIESQGKITSPLMCRDIALVLPLRNLMLFMFSTFCNEFSVLFSEDVWQHFILYCIFCKVSNMTLRMASTYPS